jgi:hypothetical protein
MSVSLRADAGGAVGALQLNGADRLVLNADGTLSGTVNPTTGVRSNVLATMQKFADEFASSLTTSGYQKLPSGLIIQWGTTGSVTTSIAITFQLAFPNGVLTTGYGGKLSGDAAQYNNVGFSSVTNTGMTFFTGTGTTGSGVRWIAIGY